MAADAPHPAFEPYAAEPVPQAPVGAPGKEGRLELAFAADEDGQTHLVRDFARVPFHLSGTLAHDPHPDAETVFVQSPNGGVAQGDRHTIDVSVANGGIAHVTTGSSTKVLTMERNYAAADVSLSVGPGSHLDYVPEPVIVNPDARYCQELHLDITPDATAVVGDVVVPGRLARGERFDFERFVSRFECRSDGDLLFEDATHLTPADGDPTAPGVMGEYAVYGTLYVVAPESDGNALSDALHDRAGEQTEDETSSARAAATTLPNGAGVVVRALGHRAEDVTGSLHAAWDEARTVLLDVGAPDGRKL
ncbi:urease accessory protein [Halomicrobium zhouii]|uniref:Urease accessory protein UreD n=1 Tax=Halomicrobium zhouii TaxID=767519 RepID=A0A1I6K7G6_9EURY|nr:urease accessory protein UreD [Halomicrobium zhouii]SFR87094.1 urease accessory protein [Halomicrobium zhouii]